MSVSSTISGYSSGVDPYAATNQAFASDDDDLGMDTFVNLLVVQLQNQDPLNPMEDDDFTAQLAQFSSLEQLENISSAVEDVNEGMLRQDMLGAVGFIGKDVLAYGSTISKEDDEISAASYTLEDDVSQMYVNVYDSDGVIVYSEAVSGRQAGTYSFTWDGTDYNGIEQPDGVYSLAISAEDADGEAVYVSTEVSGRVTSVFTENGLPQLRLSDGRQVGFYNVKEILDVTTTASQGDGGSSSDTSDDTSSDTDSGNESNS